MPARQHRLRNLRRPFADSFARADSAVTLGAPWTVLTAGAVFGIASNLAYTPSAVSQAVAVVAEPVALNQVAQAVFSVCGDSGLVLRAQDDNNYLLAAINTAATISIFQRVGGTFTQLNTASVFPVDGDTIRAFVIGTTMTVQRNGVTAVSATVPASTPLARASGIRISSSTTARLSSFSTAPV